MRSRASPRNSDNRSNRLSLFGPSEPYISLVMQIGLVRLGSREALSMCLIARPKGCRKQIGILGAGFVVECDMRTENLQQPRRA